MSDRGILFLFSIVVILVSLAVTGWQVATGNVGSFDGLFLTLTCLLVALAFGLYLVFLIRRTLEEVKGPPPATGKAGGAAQQKSSLVGAAKNE
ncbi:MAG: hypothetical protein WD696_02095 [Bryobacteraceae bacterium]